MTATSVDPDESSAETRSDASSMSVDTVRFDQTRALIKVNGELDLATAAPLWAVLQGHLAAGRRFLRLDLSGVTFLDATVLTGISRAHQELLARRGTLVITGARALVNRVLRMTGMDEVLFVSGPRADDDYDPVEQFPAAKFGAGEIPAAGIPARRVAEPRSADAG